MLRRLALIMIVTICYGLYMMNTYDQQISSALKTDYGLEVKKLTLLPLGADMNAAVYEAVAQDNSTYFVKLKRSLHHDTSVAIVKLLQDAGFQHIIPPIKTLQGQDTQPIEEKTMIVYPFIHGLDGFNRHLTDEQWILLGKALRHVHEIEVPLSLQKLIRRESYSPKWRKAVQSILAYLHEEPKGDEIALKLWKYMQQKESAIQQLVDRAEQLARIIQDQSSNFVLCHSDIHGGNVLIDHQESVYIVDWDEPILAPKERDLMFIGGGVANVWNQPHEEKLFYQGYGKVEVNSVILAYYRHERIVEDIAIYGEALLLNSEGKDREEMYQQFIDMFEPRGVVEIAFESDIPQYLYKILSVEDWKGSQGCESVKLSAFDRDFIHLATAEQLDKIAEKFWGHVPEYVILKVDTTKLTGSLVFEANPGGVNKYYHLYNGSIPLGAVVDFHAVN